MSFISSLLTTVSKGDLENAKFDIDEARQHHKTEYTRLTAELRQVEEALRNLSKANSKPAASKGGKKSLTSKSKAKPAPVAEDDNKADTAEEDNAVDVEDVDVEDEDDQ